MSRVLNHKIWPHCVTFTQPKRDMKFIRNINEWMQNNECADRVKYYSVGSTSTDTISYRAYFKDEGLAVLFALKFR